MPTDWKRMSLGDACKKLDTGKDGITEEGAAKRLKIYGKNEITRKSKASPVMIFIAQFKSPLILLLVGAALVLAGLSFLPGSESNLVDTTLILIIVIASCVSGFFQDWKAERAIEALRQMSTPIARVIRDGKEKQILTTGLVPGDVIIVEGGDVVPADAKIIQAFDIMLDESILTGESRAIRKGQSGMAFMNTSLISGRGTMLVINTGMRTQVGRLAEKMQEIRDVKTPFQLELASFSKRIFWLVMIVAAVIFALGYFKFGLYMAFLIAISLAVAAIPEGLPAVVTLALTFGAKFMVRSKALIRRLPVVESIGSINVICTDKTGTLTKNRMSVTRVMFDDVMYDRKEMNKEDAKRMEMLMLCSALCNNTSEVSDDEGKMRRIGDQTEIALADFSERFGYGKQDMERIYRRTHEISFTSKRKRMSVVCRYGSRRFVFVKGAPEIVLDRCTRTLSGGRVRKLDRMSREKILKQDNEFAAHALRVLAFGFKELKKDVPEKGIEKDLVFTGLAAMLDPPRDEVKQAIRECGTAGIRVIMITGDNMETAKAIANEVGLGSKGGISGKELSGMSDDSLAKRLDEGVNIFARTTPFDKLRILKVLQRDNRVAMTGDGVNDTLALKKADVGIAMGERGTEVAKEASDIILVDDNFATIKNAVKEGRRIFDNIRKFVNYLLTCNFSEVFVIFMATLLLALNEPVLLPVHILWINLLTDGLPALALGIDPPAPDIMERKPRKKGESILDKRTIYNIVSIGLAKSALLLTVFILNIYLALGDARTALFMGFVLYEFLRIGVIRYQEKLGFFDNRWLVLALVASLALQLVVIYTPLNAYFGTVPLNLAQWGVLLVFAVVGWFCAIYITKLINARLK
ncbi:MAG: calcium-translocating P-type ATPase, PMCA-type [Candidatus Aenigmarchaeota archaeon]|nr:calcium-translocating P-type ATPase, PMCA-type [Candidatus Aenigmarchaeota archaeon]